MTFILNTGKYFSKGEAFLLGEGLLLTRTTYSAGQTIPRHGHQNPYLSFLIKGTYREAGPGFQNLLTPGSFIFHPGLEVHENHIGGEGAVLLNFEFAEGFWAKKGLERVTPTKRVTGSDPRILDLAGRISDEIDNSERFGLVTIEGIALQILGIFLGLTVRPKPTPEVVTKVDAYLQLNFTENLTLGKLAAKFGIPKGWLAKAFPQTFGETISERLIRLRLNTATHFLRETAKPLALIALETGFYDQAHFSRAFKKRKGITPGQFRKKSSGGKLNA